MKKVEYLETRMIIFELLLCCRWIEKEDIVLFLEVIEFVKNTFFLSPQSMDNQGLTQRKQILNEYLLFCFQNLPIPSPSIHADVSDMLDYSAVAMKELGWSVEELRQIGFTLKDFISLGFPLSVEIYVSEHPLDDLINETSSFDVLERDGGHQGQGTSAFVEICSDAFFPPTGKVNIFYREEGEDAFSKKCLLSTDQVKRETNDVEDDCGVVFIHVKPFSSSLNPAIVEEQGYNTKEIFKEIGLEAITQKDAVTLIERIGSLSGLGERLKDRQLVIEGQYLSRREKLNELKSLRYAKFNQNIYDWKFAEQGEEWEAENLHYFDEAKATVIERMLIRMKVKEYQDRANQEDADGLWNLGWCFEFGIGVERDPERAAEYYNQAKNKGNMKAQARLGYCYILGKGVSGDKENGFSLIKSAAENSDQAFVRYCLGWCYYNGYGVNQDMKEAKKWYEEAKSSGSIHALYLLGLYYYNSNGIDSALELFKSAANKGHRMAINALITHYWHKGDSKGDSNGDQEWRQKGVELGDARCSEK